MSSERKDNQAAFGDYQQDGQLRQPVESESGLRSGYAAIVSNTGSGAYTITEQWRTAAGADQNAVDPPGIVGVVARNVTGVATGVAGDAVWFWQQRKIDGSIENLIVFVIAPGVELGSTLWTNKRYRVTANGTATFDAADWRFRKIWFSFATVIQDSDDGADQFDGAWDQDDWTTGVGRFCTGDGLSDAEHDLATVTNDGGSTLRLYLDDGDSGKLKLQFANFDANYTVIVTAMGHVTMPQSGTILIS